VVGASSGSTLAALQRDSLSWTITISNPQVSYCLFQSDTERVFHTSWNRNWKTLISQILIYSGRHQAHAPGTQSRNSRAGKHSKKSSPPENLSITLSTLLLQYTFKTLYRTVNVAQMGWNLCHMNVWNAVELTARISVGFLSNAASFYSCNWTWFLKTEEVQRMNWTHQNSSFILPYETTATTAIVSRCRQLEN